MSDTLLTLQRGLRLLELLAERGRPMGARELSELSGINTSTTYQLIKTLRVEEYLVRQDGGYTLGPSVGRLAGQFRAMPTPPSVAIQALANLRLAVGERCYMAGWWLSRIVMIRTDDPAPTNVPARLGPGYSGAPHARASCKAILAYLSPEFVRKYLRDSDISARTPGTRVSIDAIESDLRLTRRRGYATDEEEYEVGTSCVAAPIFDASGQPVYSLTITASTATYRVKKDTFRSSLLAVTSQASTKFGYQGPIPNTSASAGQPAAAIVT